MKNVQENPPRTTTPMPALFLEWQCEGRRSVFEALSRGEMPRFCAAHLPVVNTLNSTESAFPIHSATKGVGLIPRDEYLRGYVESIEDCLATCAGADAAENMQDRIRVAGALSNKPEEIDPHSFGTIEIFRGQTYRNLDHDPRATLLFTGEGPRYPSYQFNCHVEMVGPEHLVFRFIRGMRLLFETESFHIQQPKYPLGYVFRAAEIFNKTPRRGKAGERVGCPVHRK